MSAAPFCLSRTTSTGVSVLLLPLSVFCSCFRSVLQRLPPFPLSAFFCRLFPRFASPVLPFFIHKVFPFPRVPPVVFVECFFFLLSSYLVPELWTVLALAWHETLNPSHRPLQQLSPAVSSVASSATILSSRSSSPSDDEINEVNLYWLLPSPLHTLGPRQLEP